MTLYDNPENVNEPPAARLQMEVAALSLLSLWGALGLCSGHHVSTGPIDMLAHAASKETTVCHVNDKKYTLTCHFKSSHFSLSVVTRTALYSIHTA